MANQINNNSEETEVLDEKLVRAWIGKNNQDDYINKFQNGGFSPLAFLFPDVMVLGRKMWIEGIILVVIEFIIAWFLDADDSMYRASFVIIRFILGLLFFQLYKDSIKRKINKYKKQGLSYEQQLEKANKYGGDITIAVAIIVIILNFSVLMLNVNKEDNNNYSDNPQIEFSDNYDYDIKNRLKSYEDDDLEIIPYFDENEDTTNKENENQKNMANLEYDNWKLNYNTLEWQESKVPESISAKGMIKNENGESLVYIEDHTFKGNLSDKKYLQNFIKSFKLGMQDSLYEHSGVYEDVDVILKKNEQDIYVVCFSLPYMKEFLICKQVEENKIYSVSFQLINVYKENISEELVDNVEKMMFSIEFK
ncbi:MAG: DUF2628 domain-containing protein [Clostridia bacterium]|nr:DUF2628 domain-containing protein [Clostridia bacterium]